MKARHSWKAEGEDRRCTVCGVKSVRATGSRSRPGSKGTWHYWVTEHHGRTGKPYRNLVSYVPECRPAAKPEEGERP